MANITCRRTKDRTVKDPVTGESRVIKGKARYRALVRLRGQPAVSATFDRLTDAKKWVQDTESAIRAGRYFKTIEARRHTLGDLIDRYARDVLPRKSPALHKQQGQQLGWWKEELGSYLLADVTPALLVEARDRLASTNVRCNKAGGGKPRSGASVNRYLAALSHAFTVAVREWGWLEDSPMRKVARLKEPRGRVRFLDGEERKRLLEVCRASDEPLLYPMVVVSISTGARQGELLRVRWTDVDLGPDGGVMRLLETKNGEPRAVPLAGLAATELRRLARVRRIEDDRIFPLTPGQLRGPWEKALEQAKISGFTWHDLRHTAASYLAQNGATLAELAEILGHKTLAMVKRYAHLTEQHTSPVVARMSAAIFGE